MVGVGVQRKRGVRLALMECSGAFNHLCYVFASQLHTLPWEQSTIEGIEVIFFDRASITHVTPEELPQNTQLVNEALN